MNRTSEIRRRMERCINKALEKSMPWGTHERERMEILNPITTLKQEVYLVHRLHSYMANDIPEGVVDDEVYYVQVTEPLCIHPAYIVGTFMALLLANPKKILVDCLFSYEDKEDLSDGTTCEKILEGILKEFSEIELLKFGNYDDHEGIDYINNHKEITHLVRLGNQLGTAWELYYLREDITVHLPSASFGWVTYDSCEEMEADQNFQRFLGCSRSDVYDCEVLCDENMEVLDKVNLADKCGFVSEVRKFEAVDWMEFLEYYVNRIEKEKRIVDHIPVFIFGEMKTPLFHQEVVAPSMRIVMKEEFDFDTLFYQFSDLLKSREG